MRPGLLVAHGTLKLVVELQALVALTCEGTGAVKGEVEGGVRVDVVDCCWAVFGLVPEHGRAVWFGEGFGMGGVGAGWSS